MIDQTNIERIVMRRVHLIRVLRVIISGGVFALLLAILMLWGIGREVWVAHVFENGPQDYLGHLQYLLYAFEHTRLIVQALILLMLASLFYFVREVVRLILGFFTPVCS